MMIVSKGKFNNQQGLLVLILFAMMAVLSFYLFQHAFYFRYVQVDLLIGAISLSLFFLLILLISIQEFKAVNVYEDQIKINWLWGLLSRRIQKDDILLFSHTIKKNVDYLIIRTAKSDFILPEQMINNNTELVQQLMHWKIKRKNDIPIGRHSRIENKGVGVFFMALATFLFGFTIKTVVTPDFPIEGDQLITVSGHLSMPPDIHTISQKNAAGYIQLYLTEYPGVSFHIDNNGYNIIDLNEMKKMGKGAAVEVSVPRHEYAIKILKTEQPGYFEKHYEWATIYTYGVSANDKQLYDVETYNESKQALHNSNKKWSLLIAAVAVLMFLYGLKLYGQQRRWY
jgi:hypothetical protein